MADGDQQAGFGSKPIRSLTTFGVAGFLAEKAKVFYCSIFTTRHLGRVSDLIAAKLSSLGLDELRLRALVLFGTFEVFRAQEGATENTSQQKLVEPLVIECGLGEDRVAIGISYTPEETRYPNFDGLAERVEMGKASGAFERLLSEINAHSHGTFVRFQKSIRRVEIVALLGIPGKADEEVFKARSILKVIEISQDQKSDPPKVEAYVELGDLDYPELLKEEDIVVGGKIAPPATGEVLVHGLKELDEAIRVRATDLLESMGTKVNGKDEIKDELVRVKGEAAKLDNSTFKVSGTSQAGAGGDLSLKSSGPGAAQGNEYTMKSYGGAGAAPQPEGGEDSFAPSAQRKDKKKAVSSDKESDDESDTEQGDSNGAAAAIQDVINKVKKAWPFRFGRRKAKEEAAANEIESEESEEQVAVAKKSGGKKKAVVAGTAESDANNEAVAEGEEAASANGSDEASAAVPPKAKPVVISAADIAQQAQKLTNEIESGIEKTVNRAQSEAGDLKKEMGSNRAKRWVDGLMSELVAEKARLADASKALNTSIRQKEIEFRTKEQILTEELRRRDDMIRQKTNALNRAKDQLSQAAMAAERAKSSKSGGADDGHYKQKYGLSQKMLTSAKDENASLSQKIEDLKNQLASAQMGAKRSGPSGADFSALQAKYERSVRQADEFKKANQQLLDKLSEAKKDRISGSQDDAKKRLESAMKMATNHQKDAEKLQSRVEEMQREQMRLQAELNKANQDLKSARAGKLPGARPAAPAPAKPGAAQGAPAGAKPAGGKGNPPKAA